jgi:hypothetical protein
METISIEKYKDNFGERIGLKYRYNPDTNDLLKETLGFPKFKWEAEKKFWSKRATFSTRQVDTTRASSKRMPETFPKTSQTNQIAGQQSSEQGCTYIGHG